MNASRGKFNLYVYVCQLKQVNKIWLRYMQQVQEVIYLIKLKKRTRKSKAFIHIILYVIYIDTAGNELGQ